MVNHAYKDTTVKGQEAKGEAQKNGAKEITRAYSGKELGAEGSKVPRNGEQSEYAKQTRAGNVAMQLKKDPQTQLTPLAQQTYDEYSKQFMKQGENNE